MIRRGDVTHRLGFPDVMPWSLLLALNRFLPLGGRDEEKRKSVILNGLGMGNKSMYGEWCMVV